MIVDNSQEALDQEHLHDALGTTKYYEILNWNQLEADPKPHEN